MLTEKEIIKICEDLCSKVNYDFHIPVVINKRLKTTLGRVSYQRCGSRIKSTRMEFSHLFLSTSTPECIQDVIKHELAHYLCNELTGEHHGHDRVFKDMCLKLGTTNYNTKTEVDKIVGDEQIYKYIVTCQKCGSSFGRHRSSKLIQHPDWYSCKCGGSLKVTQNW